MLKKGYYFLAIALLITGCKFDEVEEGRLYRSPQPNAGQLQQAIDEYGIKTILNLRSFNPGRSWFDDEVAVVEADIEPKKASKKMLPLEYGHIRIFLPARSYFIDEIMKGIAKAWLLSDYDPCHENQVYDHYERDSDCSR